MSGLQVEGMGGKGRLGRAAQSPDGAKGLDYVLRSHGKWLAKSRITSLAAVGRAGGDGQGGGGDCDPELGQGCGDDEVIIGDGLESDFGGRISP